MPLETLTILNQSSFTKKIDKLMQKKPDVHKVVLRLPQ